MALSAGTYLGPYEILSALGAGGMGEVYRARDTRLDRTVAVKILPSTNPDLKARFEREARAIAALTHPHLYHRKDNLMMAVDVSTTPEFAAGRPKRLFEGSSLLESYDVARDGRFLMIKYEPRPVTKFNLVQNWIEELKHRR